MSTFKKFVAYSLVFVICSISLLGSVVTVYADSVTSLPSHSDIISTFDANNVYLDTPDCSYTISRTTSLPSFSISGNPGRFLSSYSFSNGGSITSELFSYGSYRYADLNYHSFQYIYSLSGTKYVVSAPVSFEYDLYNRYCDASYWYSPSLNSVFVVNSSYNYTLNCSSTKVLSYYSCSQGSSFRLNIDSVSCTNYFINYYNLDSGEVYQSVGQFVESSCRLSVSYFTYYTGSEFVNKSIPDDLVCIYSTYLIDGFWEIDPLSNIVTPDYFFNYQYIFEGINKQIIFIDSSKPLISFDSSSGDLRFSDLCNKRIYVSSDGVSWLNICSVNLMYSGIYTLDSKYYKDGDNLSFLLIYSNDESYGEEPLVKPGYNGINDITDLIEYLPNFEVNEEYFDFATGSNMDLLTWLFDDSSIRKSIHGLDTIISSFGLGILEDWIYSDSDKTQSEFDLLYDRALIKEIIEMFTSDTITHANVGIFDPVTGTYSVTYNVTTSPFAYIKRSFYALNNIDKYVSNLDSGFSSLFDISSFNADRLVDIIALIKSIKIPDYSKKLDSIISSLASSSGPVFDDSGIIAAINNLTIPDYSSKLDAIISRPFFDDSGIIAAINNTAFDDSAVLDAINNISITSGGGSSPTVSVDLDKLYKLLDFDISDYDDDKTDDDTRVVDFVVDGLNDLVTGTVLQDALDFAPGVLSGIGLVNGFVVNIYDNLGNYKPVVLLGLTFTVVGTVIRKEE